MSRRDTILVAVLINAGLLVILFVSALKSGGGDATKISAHSSKKNQQVISPKKKSKIKGDQVDQVIANYAKKKSSETTKVKANVAPNAKVEVAVKTPATPAVKQIAKVAANQTITVQKGDVLEKIARMHSVSVDGIMSLNQLDSTTLQIGQILKLPNEKISANSKSSATISKKVEEEYYVVMAGDNPWTIAHNHDMQVDELLKLNNMSKDKAKRLRPGDRLRIK